MGLITETIFIKIEPNNKRLYRDKGYFIENYDKISTRMKEEEKVYIEINVWDAPNSVHVDVSCDGCGKPITPHFIDYKNSIEMNNGIYYCQTCYRKNIGMDKIMKTKLQKTISFYDWCLEDEERKYFLQLWDYEKNNINPEYVTYKSAKHYYFKCKNYPDEHRSKFIQLKSITNMHELECEDCESLAFNYPSSIELWSEKNQKSPWDVRKFKNEDAWFKCENDKHIDYKRLIARSVTYDFRCPKCVLEREESFIAEKVRVYLNFLGYSILQELGCTLLCINPKTGRKFRYDFEVYELSLIIEVHGKQHYYGNGEYSNWNNFRAEHDGSDSEENLAYIQWCDKYKKEYALSQGYGYLEISFKENNKKETYKTSIDNAIQQRIYDLNNQY